MVALRRGGVRCSLRTLVTSMGATYLANNVACTWYGCLPSSNTCSNRGPPYLDCRYRYRNFLFPRGHVSELTCR